MGSTRLPGKALMPLAGQPIVLRVLERLKRCTMIDELVLAIPTGTADDPLESLGKSAGAAVFRGSEPDVLDRHYQAATAYSAKFMVRVPADNPTPEPSIIDRTILHHLASGNDFTTTYPEHFANGFPSGCGCEVYTVSALARAWKEARDPRNREHPHTFFYEHPEEFRLGTIQCPIEYRRHLDLDVNDEAQYRFMSELFDALYPVNPRFTLRDILSWYDDVYSRRVPA
jgi:spore coat polysaccharide biosynthesis protein SpsF